MRLRFNSAGGLNKKKGKSNHFENKKIHCIFFLNTRRNHAKIDQKIPPASNRYPRDQYNLTNSCS